MQVREITVGVSEMLWGTGILLLRADGRHDRHSTAETDGHRRLNEWRLLCQHSPALPPPSVKSSRTLTDCQTKDTRRLTTTPRRAAPSDRKKFHSYRIGIDRINRHRRGRGELSSDGVSDPVHCKQA